MSIIRSLLTLTATLSGFVVVARAFAGPFHLLLHVGSPLSAETICAVSLLALMLTGMNEQWRQSATVARWRPLHLALALSIVAAAYYGVTRLYFFGDDFFLVRDAVGLDRGSEFLKSLVNAKGDIYYRPFGYSLLYLFSLPMDSDPVKWHLLNLLLHLVNCVLLYGVALRLGLTQWISLFAVLLFGVHGSRCEAVVWIGGYFELLSLLFLLATLLLYLRWRQAGGRWNFALAILCLIPALWSKESAYALPLLLCILPWDEAETWMRRIRYVAPFFAVTAIAFVHRWIVLGGIGGYMDPASGRPEASSIHLLGVGKLLAGRLWAILFFPIDWDVKPGVLLAAAIAAMLLAMLYAARARNSRGLLLFAFGVTLISALPASSQMLIGADLYKSRTLYLPSLGVVLLLCVIVEAVPRRGLRAAAAAALVLFHVAALRHNFSIWEDVSRLSRSTCETARSLVEGGPREVVVVGLPGSMRGVYFFMNGFPECLELGNPRDWKVTFLPVVPAPPEQPGKTVLLWRGEAAGLVKLR